MGEDRATVVGGVLTPEKTLPTSASPDAQVGLAGAAKVPL